MLLLTLLLLAFAGGARAQESHWADINEYDFDDSAPFVAFVQIDGEFIESSDMGRNIEVGAFVGDECRGHAFLADYTEEYGDPHPMIELNIFYNAPGEEVTFKLYDHSEQQEYGIGSVSLQGEELSVLTGDEHIETWWWEDEYVVLNFLSQEPSTELLFIELEPGWNWVSFNVETDLDQLRDALKDAAGDGDIIIKSQNNGIRAYRGDTWAGALNELNLSQMYQIKVDNPCLIMLEGNTVAPADYPVAIMPGYNWIAFPLQTNMSLTEAFAGFAQNGDKIISQEGQASYNGRLWRGHLNTLEPGKGYIYYSASTGEERTLVFPTSY